jgi:TonB-linked SusC/RagA family outer membrane protein
VSNQITNHFGVALHLQNVLAMQKLLLLFASLFFLSTGLSAQRTVSGKVSAEDGSPLLGASVFVKGSTTGTITSTDGFYQIPVPEGPVFLNASYIGYSTEEIELGASNLVDFTLIYDVVQIDEIVVTANGIERQRKDLGYAVSTIDGEELIVVRDGNILAALQGKTSGVQITRQTGNLGGSTKILIRGINSLGGNNNPLWVVDGVPVFDDNISTGNLQVRGFDVGNRAQDINPDDVESISILKGAAAAALYGSRAANGVIIVTTKRGKQGSNSTVSINSSIRFDSPYRLPDFQNEYAQGLNGKYDVRFLNGWGPGIDGRTVTDFTGEEVALTAYPDNVRNFYETGQTLINNFAVSGANDNNDYRISFTALNRTGIYPGSKLNRYTIALNTGMKFSSNVSSRFGINLVRTNTEGNVSQGGGGQTQLINSFPRNLDSDKLIPWIDESTGQGQQINPLTPITNNPYWLAYENEFTTEVDRTFGNLELKYEPVFWIDIVSRLGFDFVVDDRFRSDRKGTIGNLEGDFTNDLIQQRQLDYNLLASANKDLGSGFFLKAVAGFNYNSRVFERTTINSEGLTVGQLFSYGNVTLNTPTNDFSERRLFGLYTDITLSFREWLSLNLTGRNDWSSTLPMNNNSYFYPSASVAFDFTDAFDISNDILSYGKLRVSYAQVGNDADPYQLAFTYTPRSGTFGQFGTSTTFPFNGTLGFSGTNTIPPENLRPESVNSFEVGTELQFFKGRLGLDVTYYNVKTDDQILAISLPHSTGFFFKRQNIGVTSNKGFELELSADIFKFKNFTWNTLITFTKNNFIVEELAEGLDRLQIQGGVSGITIIAEPGESYGYYGNKFRRAVSDSTRIIVDPLTGLRLPGDDGRLGDIYPNFIAGWTNNLFWKGLNLRFTIDWRDGGMMLSQTVKTLRRSGLAIETAVNREGAYIDSEAWIEDENGNLRPNDIPVRMQDFWQSYSNGNIAEGSMFDAGFIKMREIGLFYTLPAKIVDRMPLKGLTFGIEALNPFMIYSNIPHIDPETNHFGSANDGAGVEYNSPISAKSIGANLKITF